ncbi:MAG: alkaline phosphatase [Fimbriimonadaceae bacterium]|nr:alkaline phosphatase [Fimbriimonadaceae bacterium]
MQFSRRTILGAGLATLSGSLLNSMSSAQVRNALGNKPPKNVIFCVADGMASQTMSMCDVFQRTGLGHPSYWAGLMNEPYVVNGLQATRSLSSVVTDSAAASAAWGSGVHIWNGQLNILPDGTELDSLTKLASAKGVRCGLVTTTTMSHATPAGFAVVTDSRGKEREISAKYLDAGVDVLMGGGDAFFTPDDLYSKYAANGYRVVKNRSEALAATGQKILGIFDSSHLPFTIDRNNSTEIAAKVPTLAEMASVALRSLKGSPNGFLLQIEGGKVDHGAHANDLAAMFYDQIAFEEAVKVAVEFALADGETLVIITSDHACGGPSLNGDGDEYFDTTAALEGFANFKCSFAPLMSLMGSRPTTDHVVDVHKEMMGIELSKEEAETVVAIMGNNSPFKASTLMGSRNAGLALIHGNHTKVGWTSGNHTHEHVLVTAVGPGSHLVAGLTQNIRFFDLMTGVFDITHKNPTMSFEDAMRVRARASVQVESEPHWV